MTIFTFENGDIRKDNENIGWFGPGLNNPFECLVATKNILESHGHTVDVQSFKKEFEVVLDKPYIREVETGYYITELNDELNYAYFSKEMNCAKLCVNAVMNEVLK